MPFNGFTQEAYAQQLIDEYRFRTTDGCPIPVTTGAAPRLLRDRDAALGFLPKCTAAYLEPSRRAGTVWPSCTRSPVTGDARVARRE
jgi:hypothetical protein